jgi:hypothetical protein
MNSFLNSLSRSRSCLIGWVILACLCYPVSPAFAGKPGGKGGGPGGPSAPVLRIEEDWVINVREGNQMDGTPQLSCVISPVGDLTGQHAVFELNHTSLPEFVAGGMQIQAWNGDMEVASGTSPQAGRLQHANETITFTVVMEITNGTLSIEIVNGASQSWGAFGGQGYLKVVKSTNLNNLSAYSSLVSVENAGIGRASHQVDAFMLSEVRSYDAGGVLLNMDSTDLPVHNYRLSVKSQSYEEYATDVLSGEIKTLDDLLLAF